MEFLEKLKPLALLLLRAALGVIFISHGYPKLFTYLHETVSMFQQLGFPGYFAYISGVLELFGGLLLLAGLFTQIASLLLAIEMAVAIWRVHLPQGTILAVKNYEFPLALAAGAFVLATIGAGSISLDHVLYGVRKKESRRSRDRDRD